MKIEVTQDHIDRGKYGCYFCPVALAMKDAGFKDVAVTRGYILMNRNSSATRSLPSVVYDFINAYDNRQNVEPFSFEFAV